MKVNVNGKNFQVTPALKEHAEKRLLRLAKFLDRIDEAVVTQRLERNWQIADITLKAGHLILRSEEKSDDMYTSIDLAADHLEQQLRKFKGRIYARTRHHHAEKNAELPPLPEDKGDETDGGTGRPEIVRVKQFLLKPMSTEEAVLQLELLGHGFFVFTNADSEQVNVLYRRDDGNLGLIEPTPA
ncbi:MAG: ribosomal subunit interface protein [Armatimonadetes bacterium CG2_30_59_28]|nr:ribosome-associated translation inhibitor RaiA [Armatimonadota bacterium]OIO95022.1 MAG: ribosomal subunit interface protein [Armatimonadetes bacterium CG2_30_59_28]PIU67502.1 MAG: ribosomal subunit interface protein [Armatimonadetes bacterium CG07_land_8_20_14_0_80_59_28]PIX39301.1 MAG: ribosomal subunit interface protein [Armatimonadetes bacterium CG_4_8_14_3_um_filter_58_9]PIY43389.1 MAG: ribosomal subunit interface protein [Armatimonadetes bacterium CG_4_10_14_3_um_filter_59_10]PJB61616